VLLATALAIALVIFCCFFCFTTNEATIFPHQCKHLQTAQRKILCALPMRPATGKGNLRRLRELLELDQFVFSDATGMSKSYLQKLEHGRTLTKQIRERIATRTGVSPEWLQSNDPGPPYDAKGRRYSKEQFDRAQARLLDFRPFWRGRGKADIAVKRFLLQRYAEARDLFLRPEMYKYFVGFLLDLQLLCARYELKAKYPEHYTGADAIAEQKRREHPDSLFPGVVRDAEACHKASNR
jgi:transcriptional regulator with XRE-family HTH domain